MKYIRVSGVRSSRYDRPNWVAWVSCDRYPLTTALLEAWEML